MGPAILRASASRFEFEPDHSLFAAAHQRKFDALSDPKIVKPGEQIADTTPATGGRRKAAAKSAEPGAAPKRGRPKKAKSTEDVDPGKLGAKKGGNTVAPGEKKVSRRAVRSGPEKTADAYAKGPTDTE